MTLHRFSTTISLLQDKNQADVSQQTRVYISVIVRFCLFGSFLILSHDISLFLGSSGVFLTVTIARCWPRRGVTAERGHHSAPGSCTAQRDVVLIISHLLQPNLATETVPLAGERQVTAPLPLCWDHQQIGALLMVSPSCHHSQMPSAPSS